MKRQLFEEPLGKVVQTEEQVQTHCDRESLCGLRNKKETCVTRGYGRR